MQDCISDSEFKFQPEEPKSKEDTGGKCKVRVRRGLDGRRGTPGDFWWPSSPSGPP